MDIWPRGDHFSWQSEIHFAGISKDFLFCGIVRPRHVTCDISILGLGFMEHFLLDISQPNSLIGWLRIQAGLEF